MSINSFKNFKISKSDINYSNSFVYRTRCRHCLSGPTNKIYKKLSKFEYDSAQDFRNYVLIDEELFTRQQINNIDGFKYLKSKAIKMKCSRPRKLKYGNQYIDNCNRLATCRCGSTMWEYKNTTFTHSNKSFKLK